MSRWCAADWLDAGLDQLARHGPDGIKLERLCQSCHKTRGSFYHHFTDHDAYLDALLVHYRRLHTEQVIRQTDAADARQRLDQLNLLVSDLDVTIEKAIRMLGLRHQRLASDIARIDDERMRYLSDLYRSRGIESQMASRLSRLEYAAWVGSMMIWPQTDPDETREHGRLFAALVSGWQSAR